MGACKSLTHLGMALPVDLDGNGTTELVVECGNYGVLAWDPAAATLVEVNVPGITNVSQPDVSPLGKSGGREGYIKFADLNGDGLPDLLTTGPAADGSEPNSRWFRQTAQFANVTPVSAPQVSYSARETTAMRVAGPVLESGAKMVPQVTTVLDLDGDGHQELVQIDHNHAMRSYGDPPDNGLLWVTRIASTTSQAT